MSLTEGGDEPPEPSESEKWADAEIAPLLLDIAKRCGERGVSFVGWLEYEPGGDSQTTAHQVGDRPSAAFWHAYMAARCSGNFDKFAMSMMRLVDEGKLSAGNSFCFRRMIGTANV